MHQKFIIIKKLRMIQPLGEPKLRLHFSIRPSFSSVRVMTKGPNSSKIHKLKLENFLSISGSQRDDDFIIIMLSWNLYNDESNYMLNMAAFMGIEPNWWRKKLVWASNEGGPAMENHLITSSADASIAQTTHLFQIHQTHPNVTSNEV